MQFRRAFTAAIQDQKLMPDQDRFGDHVAEPAGLSQPHHSDDQMKQKNEEVAHPDNRNKTRQPTDFVPTLELAMHTFLTEAAGSDRTEKSPSRARSALRKPRAPTPENARQFANSY
jgi:hypothetical protein